MNTTLLYQTHFGDFSPVHQASIASAQAYAGRGGFEYHLYREEPPHSPYLGTLLPFLGEDHRVGPPATDFENLLYLDTDVLVSPRAPSLTWVHGWDDPTPAPTQVSAYHFLSGPLREGKGPEVLSHLKALGMLEAFPSGHANAGVIYFPQSAVPTFSRWLAQSLTPELVEWIGTPQAALDGALPFGGWDQSLINLYAYQTTPLGCLSHHWNYHLTHLDPAQRRRAYFTHYHGDNKDLLLQDLAAAVDDTAP